MPDAPSPDDTHSSAPVDPPARLPAADHQSNGDLSTVTSGPVDSESAFRAARLLELADTTKGTGKTNSFTGYDAPPGFEVERELGRGGMGVVYLAHQQQLKRLVALKIVLNTANATAVVRFLAEAEAVAAVKHPNVVEVFQFGEHEGKPFLVLEYCSGGDLSRRTKAGPTAAREAAKILASVADGVNAAHTAGVVHRDLKPHNVLLSSDGTPKVTDFGLAKKGVGSDLTPTEAVMGTPAYMSPEQASGGTKFVGPEADVWSLGVILYELLSGQKPFAGPSNLEYITQILGRQFFPLKSICPDIPRDLDLIVEKCLRQEPRERYANGGELAIDLRNWLEGKPISARSVGTVEIAFKWAKRNRAATALMLLGLLLVIGVPPLVLRSQYRIDSARRDSEEATTARLAAEAISVQREVFLLLNGIQKRRLERPISWTSDNAADITRAAALTTDAQVRAELRHEAAMSASAYDLRPLPAWKPPIRVLTLATAPGGKLIAVGEAAAWAPLRCRVALLDASTGITVRMLHFSARWVSKNGTPVQDGVRSLAFSPDGRKLYVGSRSSRIHRFDLDRPEPGPAADWSGLKAGIDNLIVEEDGKRLYGSDTSNIACWDTDTGKQLDRASDGSGTESLIWEPTRREILGGSAGPGLRYKASDLTSISGPLPQDTWAYCDWLAGKRAVFGLGKRVTIFDPTVAAREPHVLTDPRLRDRAHESSPTGVACHPSRPIAATIGDVSGFREVKVWNAGSGELLARVNLPSGDALKAGWAGPNGDTLLVSSGETIHRWELISPAFERSTPVTAEPISNATFGPNGGLLTLQECRHRDTLPVYLEPLGHEPSRQFDIPAREDNKGGSNKAALTYLGGNRIAVHNRSGKSCVVRLPVLDASKSCEILTVLPFVESPCVSADGQLLWHIGSTTPGRGGASVIDAASLQPLGRWSNELEKSITGVGSTDVLAAGSQLAIAGGNGKSLVVLDSRAAVRWQIETRRVDHVTAVAVAANDQTAASGFQSGAVHVFDLTVNPPTTTEVTRHHEGGTSAVGLTRSGEYLATGGRDRTLRLWKRVSQPHKYELAVEIAGLPNEVQHIEFDPTGDTLLILLRSERIARTWNLKAIRTVLGNFGLDW